MESHGKAIKILRTNRQKTKVEKTTDKSENQF